MSRGNAPASQKFKRSHPSEAVRKARDERAAKIAEIGAAYKRARLAREAQR
jgi:hypothetical protein